MSKDLRLKYFEGKKVRLFFDEEHMLLGLKPADKGYKFYESQFSCRKLPAVVPHNRFAAEWSDDENMLVVDLSDPM